MISGEDPSTPATRLVDTAISVGHRVATAAGLSGLLSATLLATAFALLRVGTPPADATAFAAWWDASRDRVVVGTYLVPFAGIAFLWFVAAVRQRLGRAEGLFYSTLFIGSALGFVATLFAAGAASGAVLAVAETLDTRRLDEVAAFGRALSYSLFFGFAVKMGGMFMLVVASIGRRTAALPPWLVLLTVALGAVLLIGNSFWEIVALVFPTWMSVVSVILIRLSLVREGSGATAPRNGPA